MDVYQRRRLVALSALAGIFIILVLLIRSCGGDDEEQPIAPVAGASGLSGATALALPDYIAQADAICLEANNNLAEVDATDAATAAAEQAEIVTSELQQLQTLPAPTDGEDDVQAFLDALEQLAIAYDDLATALEREDETAAADFEVTIDETSAEVLDAADTVGFEVCGDTSQVGETNVTGDGGDGGDGSDDAADTTDTGGAAPTDTGVVPETPPTDTVTPPATDDTATGAPTPPTDTAPPADTGDSSSGGVSP
jgi:hypothetical protein